MLIISYRPRASRDHSHYLIHFEITGYPCHVIGSQRAIYSQIALSFALFFSANENGTVKQNNQSDFKAYLKQPITLQENERQKKPLFGKFGYLIVRFQIGFNKVAIELRVVQFWSEIIRTCDFKSNSRCALVQF